MQALAEGCVCDYCAAMRSRINDAVLSTSARHIQSAARASRDGFDDLLAQLAQERRARINAQDRLDELLDERSALRVAFSAIVDALEAAKVVTVKR